MYIKYVYTKATDVTDKLLIKRVFFITLFFFSTIYFKCSFVR